jgi:hypothetical protein
MNNAMDAFFSPFRQTVDHFLNMPVTNWNRFFNPQFVLNYNDAGVENHVLSRVGSYGSQLSTLIEMISILRASLPQTLSEQQKQTVDEFNKLLETSKKAVAEYRGKISTSEEILAGIEELRNTDAVQYHALKKQIAQMSD